MPAVERPLAQGSPDRGDWRSGNSPLKGTSGVAEIAENKFYVVRGSARAGGSRIAETLVRRPPAPGQGYRERNSRCLEQGALDFARGRLRSRGETFSPLPASRSRRRQPDAVEARTSSAAFAGNAENGNAGVGARLVIGKSACENCGNSRQFLCRRDRPPFNCLAEAHAPTV